MSFTTNIQIQKQYPAVQYEPNTTQEPSGLWHEDHEINGALYRASNASFNEMTTKWSLVDTTQPAYAEVKNTDGSISYLNMPANSTPWSTSAWLGTGQPLIYHAVNYGMSPNNAAATNTTALQAALTAAFNGGGIVFIPPGVYQVGGTISLTFTGTPGTDHGIIIAGVGGDTELVQNGFFDLFSFTGLSSGRGVRLRDLRITFGTSGVVPPIPPAAVRTANSQNITCERVYFRNFPSSLVDDNRSLQCGLFDCTIDYTGSALNGQTMVTLTGSQDFIDHCVFRQQPVAMGGPTGCVGLLIGSASTVLISNTHISDFDTGILIQGGGVNLHHALFSNISCQSNITALKIQPTNSSGTIYELFFVNCVFARTGGSTSATPGILIDTNSGVSTNVSDICFANCMSHDWAGPGMQINGGQDIVVTGGRYGMDATDNSMTTSGAIAVTGPAVRVSLLGADCSGKIPSYNSQPPAQNQQPYGISVTGAVVDMEVRGCNLTNTKTGALHAVVGSDLRVTDCDGYNDQGTVLQSTIPPPANPVTNKTPWTNVPQGWFGPIAFYITGAGNVSIGNAANQFNTHLADGGYTLSPGEEAIIATPGSATHFLAMGK